MARPREREREREGAQGGRAQRAARDALPPARTPARPLSRRRHGLHLREEREAALSLSLFALPFCEESPLLCAFLYIAALCFSGAPQGGRNGGICRKEFNLIRNCF